MSFADIYFKRFNSKKEIIAEEPADDLFLAIVIPVFNEDKLCESLQSLKNCDLPEKSAEVIVIINSSEDTDKSITEKNRKTYELAKQFAKENSNEKLKFYILNFENFPRKFSGVGLARKTGMDEALHRFNFLNKPEGLIAGFDADALAEKNYLKEIENYFKQNPHINACSVNFEHPTEGQDFPENIYENIINYELHLRYFTEALRFANFPFAYHTIGSSFVVRADIYAKQGGMNRRKAGEDFYFLQKIIPLGNYGEINNTTVFPSPRISDRVPFGTGAAISKMIENKSDDFGTYDFESFIILKNFFRQIPDFFRNIDYNNIPEIIYKFLVINEFEKDYAKIKSNSPNLQIFEKRFFDWFNAFRVIKFLNFAHEKYFSKKKVKEEATELLKNYHKNIIIPEKEKELLFLYRNIQNKRYEK